MGDADDPRLADIFALFEANRASPHDLAGMARFGINTASAYGVRMPVLRGLARELGRDHELAGALWATGIHEGRILAGLIGEPDKVTPREMERWVLDIDSWDVCDGLMGNLYTRGPHGWAKAHAWTARPEEFVKRAGFVLMARLAVHDKAALDRAFLDCLPAIEREAYDERNFVKKAVNWALRQIGKRNKALNAEVIACAERIKAQDTKPARWIANDALRELKSDKAQARLR